MTAANLARLQNDVLYPVLPVTRQIDNFPAVCAQRSVTKLKVVVLLPARIVGFYVEDFPPFQRSIPGFSAVFVIRMPGPPCAVSKKKRSLPLQNGVAYADGCQPPTFQ